MIKAGSWLLLHWLRRGWDLGLLLPCGNPEVVASFPIRGGRISIKSPRAPLRAGGGDLAGVSPTGAVVLRISTGSYTGTKIF